MAPLGCSEEGYPPLTHTQCSLTDLRRYWVSVCCRNLWIVERKSKKQPIYWPFLNVSQILHFFGQSTSHVYVTKLGPGTVHAIDCGGYRVVEEGIPRTPCLRAATKNAKISGNYKDLILLGNFWYKISFMDQQYMSSKILGNIFYILSLNVDFPFPHHSLYDCKINLTQWDC